MILLDGNVMMITNGYKVSPYAAGHAPEVSDPTYLLNFSSNTWISIHTPP
jgi:hypothetical protein